MVDFKIQSSHTEKVLKNDFRHFAYKSQAHGETITDLDEENIVLYKYNINTHDSCIFDQLIANVCPVRQMCCKLKLKTLNNRKTTASLQNHRKHRVCSNPFFCPYTAIFFFFSAKFCTKSEDYFPDRLILL